MKQEHRRSLFAAYSEGDAEKQQEVQQQAADTSWLSCGTSFNPTATMQRLGLVEQQQRQVQQQSLLLREFEAERAAKEELWRAEEALVAGEISLESDEREHRRQLKLQQERRKEQQEKVALREQLILHSHQRQPIPDQRRRSPSRSNSDDSVILIEDTSSVAPRRRRHRDGGLGTGGIVSSSVLRALEEGAAAQETIWDTRRMQPADAAAPSSPQLPVAKQRHQKGRRAAQQKQHAAGISSSSSSSSRAIAEAVAQGAATAFPIERRRQPRKARAGAAASEDSLQTGGEFSVYVEGLDAPLVFPTAEGPHRRADELESSSSTDSDGEEDDEAAAADRWQQQQQHEELLVLQQQDRLLTLGRQKPQDVGLWAQLVALQEQLLQQQQPLLLSALPSEQLLLRQQDVLDVACTRGKDGGLGGEGAAAAAGAAPALLVLRRLLLLRQIKAPLSDPAWLLTAAFIGNSKASLQPKSSSSSSSSSSTNTTLALTRCLCSAAAVTPQYSEESARLLLYHLLGTATQRLPPAPSGGAAPAIAEAAPPATTDATAAAQEYRTAFALLQEVTFGFLLPLEARAGRVAFAAAITQAVGHLALLYVRRQQQLQQGGLGGHEKPLEELEKLWNDRGGSGSLRVGEVGWGQQQQQQQQQQSSGGSSAASGVYVQLCDAADATITALREAQRTLHHQLLQCAAVSSSISSLGSSSRTTNGSSNSSPMQGLRGFASYWAADFGLSASAWRSRLGRDAAAADGGTAAAAAAESAAAAGKIAAAAAIAAAADATKVGEAAAAANAAAAAAAAEPSFAAVDSLRRAAEAAAAAARTAAKSATEARAAAAAAAAADLKLPSPYSFGGDGTAASKQWELLRPFLLAVDAVLAAEAGGAACCSKARTDSCRSACTASAAPIATATGAEHGAAYGLILGVLDFLGAPTLHRFPSTHPRVQRGDTAASGTDAARLRCLALQMHQRDGPGYTETGSKDSNSSDSSRSSSISSSAAAAFAFWWPTYSLWPAGESVALQRQTRAISNWLSLQRELRRAVLGGEMEAEQPGEDGDAWLVTALGNATSPQAFAALLCTQRLRASEGPEHHQHLVADSLASSLAACLCALQALLAFPDDRLLLYCALCLCPSPKVFRLILKRNESDPALWLSFASSLFLQAAEKAKPHVAATGTQSAQSAGKNSPQALLLQGRKVLLTCCSAFAAHAPLAASWAFLELTTAAAAAAVPAVDAREGEQQQEANTAVPLPSLLSFGFPWACWLGRRNCSKFSNTCDHHQRQLALLPFEGWGLSAAATHVAVCSAERSFLSLVAASPGVPAQQQQQPHMQGQKQQAEEQQKQPESNQQQQQGSLRAEDEGPHVGPYLRSHVAASCAVLLQRSAIAPSGAAAVTAAASSAFPLLTSGPWANLFMALLLHGLLSPTVADVWDLFEKHRGSAAAASVAAAAAAAGDTSCCVCCCGCSSSDFAEDPRSSNSSSSSSSGGGSVNNSIGLGGLCSTAEAARCEELALGFVLVLLLTLTRTGSADRTDENNKGREEAAAEDMAVLLRASRWMLGRFSSNPFFLAVHSQLLLRQGSSGRRGLRHLYKELLRGPPWPPTAAATAGAARGSPATEEQLSPWPSAATLESACLSEWLMAGGVAANVSLQRLQQYALWASSSSSAAFALLQRLPRAAEGMPCGTAVLQREQLLWVYLQALLLSSGSNKYSWHPDDRVETDMAVGSLDGSFLSELCEGLGCCPKENDGGEQEEQRDKELEKLHEDQQQQLVAQMEERLLQAVSLCPFSKRLWLLLLHILHVKRRLAGPKAETALKGGAVAAEEVVLLLDEALQRGIFFHADPLAAIATS